MIARGSILGFALGLAAVALVLAFFVLPVAYLAAVSLKTPAEVTSTVFWPNNPTYENWKNVGNVLPVGSFLANSILASVFASLGTLAIAFPAAYAIDRYKTGGTMLSSIAIGLYVAPPVIALLPLFFLLKFIGLLHTLSGLTLVYAMMNVPVALWLLLGFLHRIPKEIDQAAAMDGASSMRTLVSVIMPTMTPGLVATAIICGVLTYNEFLFAFFMTTNASRTMPVALALFGGDQIVNYGQMATASLVGLVPIAIAVLFFQRWLVGGLTAGSAK